MAKRASAMRTGWGLPVGKKPSKMMDKGRRTKTTKSGPDDNNSTKMAENLTAPKMPQRDGPARDTMDGGKPQKPATSAKAASTKVPPIAAMKKSLAGIGRF